MQAPIDGCFEFYVLLKFSSVISFVPLLQKLSANAAIVLHSHPHLHQSILPILSCGVKLISSSQLFHLLIRRLNMNSLTSRVSILCGFSKFIYLIISFRISEQPLTLEKDFEHFFPYHSYKLQST